AAALKKLTASNSKTRWSCGTRKGHRAQRCGRRLRDVPSGARGRRTALSAPSKTSRNPPQEIRLKELVVLSPPFFVDIDCGGHWRGLLFCWRFRAALTKGFSGQGRPG